MLFGVDDEDEDEEDEEGIEGNEQEAPDTLPEDEPLFPTEPFPLEALKTDDVEIRLDAQRVKALGNVADGANLQYLVRDGDELQPGGRPEVGDRRRMTAGGQAGFPKCLAGVLVKGAEATVVGGGDENEPG